jgi:HPr kinase/phosphorylase
MNRSTLRRRVTVRTILERFGEDLQLELVAGEGGVDNRVPVPEIHRPGMALMGYVDVFTFDRVQVLGNTELLYLESLGPVEAEQALETVFQFKLPCVVVTNGDDPPESLMRKANEADTPLLRTDISTTRFTHLFHYYLDDLFAPRVSLHGSLVDVYGIGLLLTGRSGIGKSEVALDLVERGHRLVADDLVLVTRSARGVIMGEAREDFSHVMEIRGLGVVDVRSVFGIQGVRKMKRIEVEVRLVEWDQKGNYDRTGLEEQVTTILGVEIPCVTLPILPGKNITVISEVIALNYQLRLRGYHPAQAFNEQLKRLLAKPRRERHRSSIRTDPSVARDA